jgi:cytochrome c peroxidase
MNCESRFLAKMRLLAAAMQDSAQRFDSIRYLSQLWSVRRNRRVALSAAVVGIMLAGIATSNGQYFRNFIPNGIFFPNPNGASQTYSANGGGIDQTGPFFQSLGTNGRTCGTCHQPSDGMSISAADVDRRFYQTQGTDPIFRTVDGSNCDHDIDVSTFEGRKSAYSLLRTRGLIRIFLAVPANANYQVTNVSNPYGCNETSTISMYRRPLPATNVRFLSAVMFDGRESSPATGTTKILYSNYPDSLISDLEHQSLDATTTHAQGDGTRPTPEEQQEIVNFEMGLTTAQAFGYRTGPLNSQGANGGPQGFLNQPFFISINSSIHYLLSQFEQPGGLVTPGDGEFTPTIFDTFDAWQNLPAQDPRAAVARGQALFNSLPINITGVAGINDDVSEGGLVAGGIPSLTGTCGTCHDTPNVGNHSFPTPLDIGTGDLDPSNASANLGGLDISYLPTITVCKTDPSTGLPTNTCKTTTDLGQALIDGNFDHVGKIKGPILRGLSARAPYFHNGSARTLLDVVHFYETRFDLTLTQQQESDLVAFLGSL